MDMVAFGCDNGVELDVVPGRSVPTKWDDNEGDHADEASKVGDGTATAITAAVSTPRGKFAVWYSSTPSAETLSFSLHVRRSKDECLAKPFENADDYLFRT